MTTTVAKKRIHPTKQQVFGKCSSVCVQGASEKPEIIWKEMDRK